MITAGRPDKRPSASPFRLFTGRGQFKPLLARCCISLVEQDVDAFLLPEGAGETFSLIEIVLITGRSLEAKRRLYAAMVEELAPFRLGPDEVRVILIESPAENWGLRGRPASEIDLGFAIDV